MKKIHEITSVFFENENIIIEVDGQIVKLKIEQLSKKIALANETDKNNFYISPSGYGIHWPTLDEDLSINGLFNLISK